MRRRLKSVVPPLVALCATLLFSACGQKGPLTLPPPPPAASGTVR